MCGGRVRQGNFLLCGSTDDRSFGTPIVITLVLLGAIELLGGFCRSVKLTSDDRRDEITLLMQGPVNVCVQAFVCVCVCVFIDT